MTEDLRALLRADLDDERPPPLGDVVAAAIRDGRRMRRNWRLRTFGASAAVLAALATGVVIVSYGGVAARPDPAAGRPADPVAARPAGPAATWPAGAVAPGRAETATSPPPQTVPIMPTAPMAPPEARTLTIHSGTVRAGRLQKKATSAAMLHLLTLLLPPGRTSHYGVSSDDDLHVQLYLDDGNGPAMVRVALDKNAPYGDESPRGDTVTVTIQHMPDNCAQSLTVGAEWPDGTLVQVDVASCLPFDGVQSRPTRSALTTDQAVRVASDPRWGVTMDQVLVAVGAQQFPRLPVFS